MGIRKITFMKLITLSFILICFSCKENHFKDDKVLGGIKVSSEMLNLGKTVYTENCMACHGVKGDGNGVAAKGMVPYPRNFKTGVYKFLSIPQEDGLPPDSDFKRIISKGLHGTAMFPWDIKGKQLDAVIHYIKTFALDVWEDKELKIIDTVKIIKDPFSVAYKQHAIQKGKEVYHAKAQCFSCHMGYVTLNEYSKITKKVNDDEEKELPEDFYKLKVQDSDAHAQKIVPPDFTWHRMKSFSDTKGLYVRLAAGVHNVMPTWQGVLEDDEIWAVAYYVKHLMTFKDTDKRKQLMKRLKRDKSSLAVQ
jgi:mono/diheme cytochrome c family protein